MTDCRLEVRCLNPDCNPHGFPSRLLCKASTSASGVIQFKCKCGRTDKILLTGGRPSVCS